MFEALISGLVLIFQWPAIGYLLLGIFIGIWFGAVPGLGGVTGLVILIPFTFDMQPVSAFALLLGMYAVTSTSDTIASVLLGIPGTAASQATILDGHPLAKKGHAARAFGAAFTVSAFGGVFGALVLAISVPLILPIILAFASPELFMLGVLGLSMVGALSGRSIAKGLAVAALGLLVSTVGYAETVAIPRFWFGFDYLLDGVPLIPVVLGLFAIPELMELATRKSSISAVPKDQAIGGNLMAGVKDAWLYKWLSLRCATIGIYVGMLPGIGDSIVDWVAYGHAVQSTKDKPQFGDGDIRGVIAPEAANNATKAGALIPTVAFGIPGSVATAILLGAFMIQGLKPGVEMLTTHLDLTFSMVWTIVVANILAAGLLMVWSQQVAKVAFLPGHILVPGVIVTVFMGAWLGGASLGTWVTCIFAGALGYLMKQGGWPRPPLILALILGPIMENALQITMRVHGGIGWLGRPLVLLILAIIVVTIFLAWRNLARSKGEAARNMPSESNGEAGALFSTPISLVLIVLFVYAGLSAQPWPASVKQFPIAIVIPGALFAAWTLFADSRNFLADVAASSGVSNAVRLAANRALVFRSVRFLGYLVATLLVALLIGQKLALPLFVAAYLWRWSDFGRRTIVIYSGVTWAALIIFYDRVLHVFWYPSWLSSWLPALLPAWAPAWLLV
ncbi:MAG: tripartite tricarboxylate transporter permease [Alphaproteobacteria bacterium]|nr:tripartite tricarboxylate transporter permease [Alphaproteobacteria bacterium]